MNQALTESREWFKKLNALNTIKSLEKNNISACYVETVDDARQKILDFIPPGSRVGYGGSWTLEQIGIKEALRNGDYQFIDREIPGISDEEQEKLRRESLFCDIFLMSANALTMDGKLVNMDGTGNRVAALIFGPRKVVVVVGVNKIVADIDAAVHRIKNMIAPIHGKRRGREIPCAKVGHCIDCHAPARFCNALVVIEHQYLKTKDRITVIIVGQELGI